VLVRGVLKRASRRVNRRSLPRSMNTFGVCFSALMGPQRKRAKGSALLATCFCAGSIRAVIATRRCALTHCQRGGQWTVGSGQWAVGSGQWAGIRLTHCLSNDVVHNIAMNVRESEIATRVPVGKSFVVKSHEVQDCGV